MTFSLALTVAWSRVYLRYHTIKQVTVGFSFGILFGFLWYYIVETIFRPFIYPTLVGNPISKFLLLRDSSHVGNVFQFDEDSYSTALNKRKLK